MTPTIATGESDLTSGTAAAGSGSLTSEGYDSPEGRNYEEPCYVSCPFAAVAQHVFHQNILDTDLKQALGHKNVLKVQNSLVKAYRPR